MRKTLWAAAAALAFLTAGCGGGSSSSTSSGQVTLSITDAPVDTAAAVQVTVRSATLEGVQGASDDGPFPVDDQFDLLAYQGTDSRVLLTDVSVLPGTYKVRLDLDLAFDADNPAAQLSYIAFAAGSDECSSAPEGASVADDGSCRYPLRVPSGEQAGFRPKGELVVTAGQVSSFTVEFDLRKNMTDPSDARAEYVLKPTGLRLVNDDTVGVIRGTVAPEYITGACTPAAARVYLYDWAGTTEPFVPDDIHDGNERYVTSVAVTEVLEGDVTTYRYTIGFVEAGSAYALALLCAEDTDVDEDLPFLAAAEGIAVVAGQVTPQDLRHPEDALPPP